MRGKNFEEKILWATKGGNDGRREQRNEGTTGLGPIQKPGKIYTIPYYTKLTLMLDEFKKNTTQSDEAELH